MISEDIDTDLDVDEKEDDGSYKIPWFRNRVIVARIIIFGAIAFGVLWFILSNMYN